MNQSKMQQSGGLLLPPVQKLVATIIFAKGKNANQIPPSFMMRVPPSGGVFYWRRWRRFEPIKNATVRWTVAATSSKTGGYYYFCQRQKCKSNPSIVAFGRRFSLAEMEEI